MYLYLDAYLYGHASVDACIQMFTAVRHSLQAIVKECRNGEGFIAKQNWGGQGSSADMLLPDIPNTREIELKERKKLK